MNPTYCPKTAELQQVLREAQGPLQHLRAFLNGLPSASQGGSRAAASEQAYEFACRALARAEAERAICLQALAEIQTQPEVCDLAELVRGAASILPAQQQPRLLLDLPAPSQTLWLPRERVQKSLAVLLQQALEAQNGPVHVFAPSAGEGMHITLTWSLNEGVDQGWSADSVTALALLDLARLEIEWSAPQLPAPQTGLVLRFESTLHPHALTTGGRFAAA